MPGSAVLTYTYDDKGRVATQQLTGEPLITYTYDDLDRLVKVENTTGSTTTTQERYAYDGTGRLISWWHNNDYSRTDYDYDSDGNLLLTDRTIPTPPAGTNTSTQNSQMAACYANINSGSCPSAVRTALQSTFDPDSRHSEIRRHSPARTRRSRATWRRTRW